MVKTTKRREERQLNLSIELLLYGYILNSTSSAFTATTAAITLPSTVIVTIVIPVIIVVIPITSAHCYRLFKNFFFRFPLSAV